MELIRGPELCLLLSFTLRTFQLKVENDIFQLDESEVEVETCLAKFQYFSSSKMKGEKLIYFWLIYIRWLISSQRQVDLNRVDQHDGVS